MTAPALHEYVVAAGAFAVPPTVGSYLQSPSGQTVLLVAKVRPIRDHSSRVPQLRIFVSRLRRCTLPPDLVVAPWPKPQRAAPAPQAPDADAPAIVPAKARAKAQRDHARALLADDRSGAVVPMAQLNKLTVASWSDPDDTNPQRRTARQVQSYRHETSIERLLQSGTINRAQAWAATTFRNDWERAQGLGLGAHDLGFTINSVGGSSSNTTPTELQLFALDKMRQTKVILGSLWEIAVAVIINEETLRDFAKRTRSNPAFSAGRFLATCEVLSAHYTPAAPTDRATINVGQYAR